MVKSWRYFGRLVALTPFSSLISCYGFLPLESFRYKISASSFPLFSVCSHIRLEISQICDVNIVAKLRANFVPAYTEMYSARKNFVNVFAFLKNEILVPKIPLLHPLRHRPLRIPSLLALLLCDTYRHFLREGEPSLLLIRVITFKIIF